MCIKKLFNRFFSKKYEEEEFTEPGVYNIERELPDGVVKNYTMMELMGRTISTPEAVYVPVKITVFEDNRWKFEFNKFNDDAMSSEFEHFVVEKQGTLQDEQISIVIDYIEFNWDVQDEFFRWIPFGEPKKAIVFNPWIEYFSNGELRIQKDFAEHNLSTAARDYAFYSCDEYYSWNVSDGSYAVVMYEVPSAMTTIDSDEIVKTFEVEINRAVRDISYVNKYYYKELTDMTIEMMYARYKQNKQRTLWKPVNKSI